jgi:Tfp pilus assembly protein PilF
VHLPDKPNKTPAMETQLLAQLEKRPEAPQLHGKLALVLRQQKRPDEALVCIDKALELAPDGARFHKLRGGILMDLGHKKSAVSSILTAVDMQPENIEFRLVATRFLLANLKPEKAQQHIDAALELEPEPRSLMKMKRLQMRINGMRKKADRNPLDWASRQFNRRIANVAKEEGKK